MKPVALCWLFCVGCALASPPPSLKDPNQAPPLTQKDAAIPLKSTSSDKIVLKKQSQTSAEVLNDGPESKIQPDRNGRDYNTQEGLYSTQDGYHMQEGFEGYLVPTAGMHYGTFAVMPWMIFAVGLGILLLACSPFLLLPLIALFPKKLFLLKLLHKVINKLKGKKIGRMMPSHNKLAELTSNVFQAVQKYGQMQSLDE